MILWRVWLNRCLDGGEKEYMLDWSSFLGVPEVVPRTGSSANGSAAKSKKAQ
jgi:dihydroceramidase